MRSASPRLALTVLTPLYDPAGTGIDLFRCCRASILGQEGLDLTWVVSVTAAAQSYEQEFDELGRISGVRVVRQAGPMELGRHLALAVELVGPADTHILCHDDVYAGPDSASTIAEALRGHPALIVSPVAWTPPGPPAFSARLDGESVHVEPESRVNAVRESWGLNTMGGLSTAAWTGGSASVDVDDRYSLLADLALRRGLRSRFGGLGILDGGLVREARWPGQSQYQLAGRQQAELSLWMQDAGRPAWASRLTPQLGRAHRGARKLARIVEPRLSSTR